LIPLRGTLFRIIFTLSPSMFYQDVYFYLLSGSFTLVLTTFLLLVQYWLYQSSQKHTSYKIEILMKQLEEEKRIRQNSGKSSYHLNYL